MEAELTNETVRERIAGGRTFECATDKHWLCSEPMCDCTCSCHRGPIGDVRREIWRNRGQGTK